MGRFFIHSFYQNNLVGRGGGMTKANDILHTTQSVFVTPPSLKRQKKGPKEHDGSKKANQKNASTVYDIMH